MSTRPEVITLCGSMRFFPLMLEVAAEETAAGRIVLAPFAVVAQHEQGGEFKARLDELHRRKIDMADWVLIVTDRSAYYGTSTAAEIAYATAAGKPVSFRIVGAVADGEQARGAVEAAIAELEREGRSVVHVHDVVGLPGTRSRSRAWLRRELVRLVDAGRLAWGPRDDGSFRIVHVGGVSA
jgi:nucleoside 2-deoxyribosyltransferase